MSGNQKLHYTLTVADAILQVVRRRRESGR
jgi:hypothetical protein